MEYLPLPDICSVGCSLKLGLKVAQLKNIRSDQYKMGLTL